MQSSVKTIYVVRNPEKVAASFFVFERSYRPCVQPANEWLLSAAKGWVSHVQRWSQRYETLVLRYEDLMRETRATLNDVAEFLDVEPEFSDPLLPPRLVSKWRGRWIRLVGTDSPTTEILTGDQQGASFDGLFDCELRDAFWDIVGPVADRFGYGR